MSAPQYVPRAKAETVRSYSSPPRRPQSWKSDRPADFQHHGQPVGPQLGHPGPDQGFAFKLARRFEGELSLSEGEHEADAVAGCVLVAMRRAASFGRAPVIHDLRLAFTLYGFLGEVPEGLVEFRRPIFEEVASPHYYSEQRYLVDLVDSETLRLTPDEVAARVAGDWRSLFTDAPAPVEVELPESELVSEPESELVVEPEPEPEPELEPVPEPEPVASVEELVDEAREAGQLHDSRATAEADLGGRDEVRAKAVEAAARAHRERADDAGVVVPAADTPPEGQATGASEPVATPAADESEAEPEADATKAPPVKKVRKVKKIKKIRRIKRVVKKPAAGGDPKAKPGEKPDSDSLFGRPDS